MEKVHVHIIHMNIVLFSHFIKKKSYHFQQHGRHCSNQNNTHTHTNKCCIISPIYKIENSQTHSSSEKNNGVGCWESGVMLTLQFQF
jgi:hypothetical protein